VGDADGRDLLASRCAAHDAAAIRDVRSIDTLVLARRALQAAARNEPDLI